MFLVNPIKKSLQHLTFYFWILRVYLQL